ncbi:MAG: hypothetical protein HKN91_11370, partial [Acidimicrobiia bacterium]|nr:hypothetical protein [Acidimicrobiia bacterium]
VTKSKGQSDTPCVAVLLALHNGEPWITPQVESILEQVGVDVEIFVQPFETTDASMESLRAFHDDRITLLPEHHIAGAASNFLAMLASGVHSGADYVAFADQDDIWLCHKLDRAISVMRAQQAAGYSSSVLSFGETRSRLIKKHHPQTEVDYMFESPGPGCTFVLDRSLADSMSHWLRNLGNPLLGEVGYHDWLVYAYARSRGFAWTIDDSVTMLYRQHAGNVLGAPGSLPALTKRFNKARSGWYREEVLRLGERLGYEARLPLGGPMTQTLPFRGALSLRRSKPRSLAAWLAFNYSTLREASGSHR